MGVVVCPICKLKVTDFYDECFGCGAILPKKVITETNEEESYVQGDSPVVNDLSPEREVNRVTPPSITPSSTTLPEKETGGSKETEDQNNFRRKKNSVLSIIAVIFSVFAVGIVFAIIDLAEARKNDNKKHNLSIIAGVISMLFLFLYIVAAFSDSSSGNTNVDIREIPTVEQIEMNEETGKTYVEADVTEEINQEKSEHRKNALKSAIDLLNVSAFSYKGLIDELKQQAYSDDEAKYGADNCGADWKEQSVKMAGEIISDQVLSRKELVSSLMKKQFTKEEAVYGADNSSIDWNEQAVAKGQEYVSAGDLTRELLIEKLKKDGYSASEASNAAIELGLEQSHDSIQAEEQPAKEQHSEDQHPEEQYSEERHPEEQHSDEQIVEPMQASDATDDTNISNEIIYYQPDNDELLVWVSDDGKRYHIGSNCSGMKNNVRQVTIQEAKEMGRTACKRCNPPQ